MALDTAHSAAAMWSQGETSSTRLSFSICAFTNVQCTWLWQRETGKQGTHTWYCWLWVRWWVLWMSETTTAHAGYGMEVCRAARHNDADWPSSAWNTHLPFCLVRSAHTIFPCVYMYVCVILTCSATHTQTLEPFNQDLALNGYCSKSHKLGHFCPNDLREVPVYM